MRNPNTGVSQVVFDGFSLGLVDQTTYTVYGLVAGINYLFSVQAVNFNHVG